MSKIRIRNFGPIREGYTSDDGFMDIRKVTVFIGEQGTGKSTVAKLFTLLTWLEKSWNRIDVQRQLKNIDVRNAIEWQRISGYLLPESEMSYAGNAYSINFSGFEAWGSAAAAERNIDYVVPKIMYVPSERNFLTTIKSANNVTGLSNALLTFAEELKRAQLDLKGEKLRLPFREYDYEYDEFIDASYIHSAGHSISLLEASSGLQSLIPLYLVSKAIATSIATADDSANANISVNQLIRRNDELARITMDSSLYEEQKRMKINEVLARYHNKCFINIVEEPEQNLFPASQRQMLNSLVGFANMSPGNKLVMTTHSPYLINYLSIAIQGGELLGKIRAAGRTDLEERLNSIVPLKSCLAASDVVIYQLHEDGHIEKLPAPEGIPSDSNYLNDSLAEGNKLFGSLLDIEDEL